MKEEDMMVNLIQNLIDLSPVEFVEEYNRQMDANLIVDEITFAEKGISYQIWEK